MPKSLIGQVISKPVCQLIKQQHLVSVHPWRAKPTTVACTSKPVSNWYPADCFHGTIPWTFDFITYVWIRTMAVWVKYIHRCPLRLIMELYCIEGRHVCAFDLQQPYIQLLQTLANLKATDYQLYVYREPSHGHLMSLHTLSVQRD